MIKHFLDIESQSKETIAYLIQKSHEMKQTKYVSKELEHKTVGLIFEKIWQFLVCFDKKALIKSGQ